MIRESDAIWAARKLLIDPLDRIAWHLDQHENSDHPLRCPLCDERWSNHYYWYCSGELWDEHGKTRIGILEGFTDALQKNYEEILRSLNLWNDQAKDVDLQKSLLFIQARSNLKQNEIKSSEIYEDSVLS